MRQDHAKRPAATRPRLRRPFWRRYWPWLLMCALAAAAIGCGYVGFRQSLALRGESRPALTVLYLTVQLFVLESGPVPGPVPPLLDVARFLAPVLAAWAVVQGLALLFRDELRAMRLQRARGHTAICGLGERGMQLVRDFRAAGERVVVIESDEGNDDIRTCEELGASVVLGHAGDPSLLAAVAADRCRYVIAVCGDDGANVEVATSLHSLVEQGDAGDRPPTQCYVHMVNLRLCRLLRQHHMVRECAAPFGMRIFNVYENAARLLWQHHALERDMRRPDDPRSAHLIVIGMGQMGESVLLQAVRMAHFANGRRLRATIVDRQAGRRRGALLQRYPRFDQVCDVRFVETDVEGDGFIDSCAHLCGQDEVSTVAVCLGDDSHSLACALDLADMLDDPAAPILVRMSSEGGLASLLQAGTGDVAGRLHAFGAVRRSCSREVLLGEELDAFVRAIHASYVAQRRREGGYREDDPALRPWEELDEALRESNRHQADHIPVKLRAVGCCATPPQPGREPVEAFTDDEVEVLAAMEHARWNAERFLANWSPGPERDTARRRSPYLVPWDELPEEIKEYDRQAVRNIPALLALIGQEVYRWEEQGRT